LIQIENKIINLLRTFKKQAFSPYFACNVDNLLQQGMPKYLYLRKFDIVWLRIIQKNILRPWTGKITFEPDRGCTLEN